VLEMSEIPGEFSSTIRSPGTGLGTLQDVFPRYETLYDGNLVIHSHNDYVEAAGGDRTDRRNLRRVVSRAAVSRELGSPRAGPSIPRTWHTISGLFAACCGLLAHSLVDFNLHIPV
jgi:hypothetical protein